MHPENGMPLRAREAKRSLQFRDRYHPRCNFCRVFVVFRCPQHPKMRIRGAASTRPRMKRKMDAKMAAMPMMASSDKPLPSLLASPRVVRISVVLVRGSTGRPLVWAANERSRMTKSGYAIPEDWGLPSYAVVCHSRDLTFRAKFCPSSISVFDLVGIGHSIHRNFCLKSRCESKSEQKCYWSTTVVQPGKRIRADFYQCTVELRAWSTCGGYYPVLARDAQT